MTKRTTKDPTKLVEAIFEGLKAQTVTVLGTAAAEVVIPQLATNIKALLEQRATIAEQVEELLQEFPLHDVLMSMPGVGVKTAANILLAVGNCSDFRSAGHLAAYAGIAPVARRSGTSIRDEFPARSGNKRLKGAVAKLGQLEDPREIITAMGIFSGRHFPREIIQWAVRWYCRYGLSYRDLEEMMTERGVPVDHSTIYRWVQKYAPELDKQTRWYRQVQDWRARSWWVDETYIRVGGKWCYLYRAITAGGHTLNFYLSPKRNVAAAKRFLAKTLRSNTVTGSLRVINTDKAPALARAIAELKSEGICPQTMEHRQVKYLNNVIEGDHGRLKRILGPKGAFKNRTSAYRTLKGMEAMHSLRKGQGTMFAYGHPNPDAVIVNRVFEAA